LERYSVPKCVKRWEKVGEKGVSTKHFPLLIILMERLPIMGFLHLYGLGGCDNPKSLRKSLILIDTWWGKGRRGRIPRN
jgi:hypothetical protein